MRGAYHAETLRPRPASHRKMQFRLWASGSRLQAIPEPRAHRVRAQSPSPKPKPKPNAQSPKPEPRAKGVPMLIKKAADLRESDVTPRELFLKRREFLTVAGSAAVVVAGAAVAPVVTGTPTAAAQNPAAQKLANLKKSPFSTDEKLNSYKDITTYNNFYEFGLDKADPGKYAHSLRPRPWSVVVEGQCAKPGTYNIEDIMKWAPIEERIYRLRCVEAWSMVIPWVGLSAERVPQALRAHVEGEVRRVQDAGGPEADARADRARAALALRGGPAHGRGHAPADAARPRPVRRGAAQPERRAAAAGGAVEVRLQEHQVDRPRELHRSTSRSTPGSSSSRPSTASTPT